MRRTILAALELYISSLPLPLQSPKPAFEVVSKVTDPITPIATLRTLFEDSGVSVKMAAAALGVKPKSIYRHINLEAIPREQHIEAYEKFFEKHLGRPIKLRRQLKVTGKSKPMQKSLKSQK